MGHPGVDLREVEGCTNLERDLDFDLDFDFDLELDLEFEIQLGLELDGDRDLNGRLALGRRSLASFSPAPNSTPTTPKNRVDVYGYNLKTENEYHVLGNVAGTLTEEAHGPHRLLVSSPRLYQAKLYVMGLYIVSGNPKNEVWEFDLPEP